MMQRVVAGILWIGIVAGALASTTTRAAESPAIEVFAKSSPFSSLRLSPDGEHLAVNAAYDDGNYAVLVYRISDMKPTAMLRFPRFELASQIVWVNNERIVIAKARKLGALEKPRPNGDIIATNLDGTRQTYIYGYEQTGRMRGLSRGFGYIAGLPRLPNGRFYMRQLSWETRHSMLYDVDADTGTGKLVTDIAVPDLDFVLDADGMPRYAYGVDDQAGDLLFQNDGRGNWKPLTQLQSSWSPAAFSSDGKRVFGYYSDGGPSQLVSSDPDGQNRITLASDSFFSVGDVEWRKAPDITPFAAQMGNDKPSPRYLGESAEAELHRSLMASLPGRAVEFLDYSTDGRRVLFTLYSDRDPGGWYLFDRDQNKVHRLLMARPELRPEQLGERQVVRFTARDGLTLGAVLTFPPGKSPGSTPLPMILLPHGGPHAPGDGWSFDSDAQFLASRGYLVLQVKQGRGHRFEQAGYRQWGKAIQDDLIDGVRWAIGEHLADPTRICSYGASFGAYAAMMVAVREPGMFRCAAGQAGIYDLKMMYDKGDIRESEYGRNYLQRVIGSDPVELAANSPVNLAEKIRIPVFLAHGERDERAPFAQAKAMRAALEKSGNTPEWMAVPREGHGFYKDENNVVFYRRLEAFLARNLLSGNAAAGSTAGDAKTP
jgi:acetyl esterase/lipase